MLDTKVLLADLAITEEKFKARGFKGDFRLIAEQLQAIASIRAELEAKQQMRNQSAQAIAQVKREGNDTQANMQEATAIGAAVDALKQELLTRSENLNPLLLKLPNWALPDVPIGASEADNQLVETVGKPRVFAFTPLDHIELGQKHGMDFECANQLSGARFVVLGGAMARLHRALANFMLDTHCEYGYEEYYVPYLLKSEALVGTGQLPNFAEDIYYDSHAGQYLIPTAEVPLTNMVAKTTLNEADLPLKFMAHTPCFRREAGSYGRDVRGMIRQHQFDKVELVQIVKPETSEAALLELRADAERILQRLELPYRTILLCTGDMGFSAAKTFDLEVWLPAQNTYREISSCSLCVDFQARRMTTKYQSQNSKKSQFVHTLNGSGLAVGRTLIALLENHQTPEGNIQIPQALRPYLGDIDCLKLD